MSLYDLVANRFRSARTSGSLMFSETELAVLRTSSGVPFQLRFCPTLAHKPKSNGSAASLKASFDPFESPPPALRIADLPEAATEPSHVLVLNKYPVIAEHFILATKINKKQTHALEQDDLECTYACLKAWQDGPGRRDRRLFAFFNSGEHSGASQPHRHLQFLPVEHMREGDSWELLTDLILSGKTHPAALPFTHFACSFSGEPSGSSLLETYNNLHEQATNAVKRYIAANPGQLQLHSTEDGDSPISYNLALTTSGMVILPRRMEGTSISSGGNDAANLVALNGTALGGTLMVKHQEEWDALREKPQLLDEVLTAIGIPWETHPQPYQAHV